MRRAFHSLCMVALSACAATRPADVAQTQRADTAEAVLPNAQATRLDEAMYDLHVEVRPCTVRDDWYDDQHNTLLVYPDVLVGGKKTAESIEFEISSPRREGISLVLRLREGSDGVPRVSARGTWSIDKPVPTYTGSVDGIAGTVYLNSSAPLSTQVICLRFCLTCHGWNSHSELLMGAVNVQWNKDGTLVK